MYCRELQFDPPPRRSRDPATWDKLRTAPSGSTDFPGNANLTVVEIVTFFPRWLKTWDVIDRMASNGATCSLLAFIINKHRDTGTEGLVGNSLLKMTQNSMRSRLPTQLYAGWTFSNHTVPPYWDHSKVDVTGFRSVKETHTYFRRIPEKPAWEGQFKDLATAVTMMPSGDDALDLTRCVEYHVQHPDEEWNYPQDYEEFVEFLGGKATVTLEHSDGAAFARWARQRQLQQPPTSQLSRPSSRVSRDKSSKKSDDTLTDVIDLTGNKPMTFVNFFANENPEVKLSTQDGQDAEAADICTRKGQGSQAVKFRVPKSKKKLSNRVAKINKSLAPVIIDDPGSDTDWSTTDDDSDEWDTTDDEDEDDIETPSQLRNSSSSPTIHEDSFATEANQDSDSGAAQSPAHKKLKTGGDEASRHENAQQGKNWVAVDHVAEKECKPRVRKEPRRPLSWVPINLLDNFDDSDNGGAALQDYLAFKAHGAAGLYMSKGK
ncbi:unnamed protein product [Periconia digitata]|uniref:Uncharacterized protein n=1 Tax=Periconia digitata TaxID=1303443 RepID=A0A9W4U2P2_9PLEO|nr:unnamed protein product [Periconia digitata]